MSNQQFMNEGTEKRVEITPDGKITPMPLKFSDKASFENLREEYTFYTPAALMLFGGLPFDAVSQFYTLKGLTTSPLVIATDIPLFSGLDHPEVGGVFNHFLLAIENEHWKELALHLGTIGIKDTATRTYMGTVIQEMPMADYLALRNLTVLPHPVPMTTIYTVALDGNKACLHFQPADKPPVDLIRFVRSAPRQQTIDYSASIFKGEASV